MNSYFSAFLDLLFPRTCVACGGSLTSGEATVCVACVHALPRVSNPEEVTLKFTGKVSVASAQSFLKFEKHGKTQRLLHALKYQDKPEVGLFLGRLYAREMGLPEADGIIPVPLHPKKEKIRGYNQAEKIAKGLAEESSVPVWTDILLKKTATESQTRKSRWQRFVNTQEAFCVKEGISLENKSVILVDDVLTTGATLEACVKCLTDAHCGAVHILTMATA